MPFIKLNRVTKRTRGREGEPNTVDTREWWFDPRTITDLIVTEDLDTRVLTTTADVTVIETTAEIWSIIEARADADADTAWCLLVDDNADLDQSATGEMENKYTFHALHALNPEIMENNVAGPSVLRQVLRMRDPADPAQVRVDREMVSWLLERREDATGTRAAAPDLKTFHPAVAFTSTEAIRDYAADRSGPTVRKPRCFGVPSMHVSESEACSNCRFFATCRVIVRNKNERDESVEKDAMRTSHPNPDYTPSRERMHDFKKPLAPDSRKPRCYGDPEEYDLGDRVCGNCAWQTSCGIVVAASKERRTAVDPPQYDSARLANKWRERAAQGSPKPVCFGDPEEHAPHSHACTDCRWFQTCAVVVRTDARRRGERE